VVSLIRPALVVFALLTILTGVVYPLAVLGIAQTAFPHRANGSFITATSGHVQSGSSAVGSSLIGQDFSGDPKYFWGRPSATSPVPYTAFNADKATGSSGSNLGPTNPALTDSVKARLDLLGAADAAAGFARPSDQRAPIDLATASASGLDPHISIAAAEYQVARVALARGLSEDQIRDAVRRHTHARQLGVLGEPVVNVLNLNLALDAAAR
jgi:potassium-transporting ATPase KdpC subunit